MSMRAKIGKGNSLADTMALLLEVANLLASLSGREGGNIGYVMCIAAMAGDQNEFDPRYCSCTEYNSAASFLTFTSSSKSVLEATAVT